MPSRRERLAAELVRARDMAGKSGREMARALDVSQGTLWRYDHARTLPTMPRIRTWLDVCEVDAETRERILDLAAAAHGETRVWGDMLADVSHLQGKAGEQEQEARLVRNFQPTIIPGLLQTPEYAAHLIPIADLIGLVDHEAALAARLTRQRILYDENRRFQFLMAEHVLAWSPGPGGLLTAQADRIASLAALPSVEVAVLPTTAAVATAWQNFIVFENPDGSQYVTTELIHGSQEIYDSEQVALYVALWERLWAAASVGDDAVELIRNTV